MTTARSNKPATAPKRFSLVPAEAQQQMFRTLSRLASRKAPKRSGAEIAEVAIASALAPDDPILLACPAAGARLIRKGLRPMRTSPARIESATVAAAASLIGHAGATVLVCLGSLKSGDRYREAFDFAARHKLPVLFLLANRWQPGKAPRPDLRTLYAEFGIPVFSVDADDAIAAYRVATEALHNARHGRGPAVIEALPINAAGRPGPLELLRLYMERHGNTPE